MGVLIDDDDDIQVSINVTPLVDVIPLFSSLGTTYGFVFMNAADIPNYTLLGGVAYRLEDLKENLALAEYQYHIPGVFVQGGSRPTSGSTTSLTTRR